MRRQFNTREDERSIPSNNGGYNNGYPPYNQQYPSDYSQQGYYQQPNVYQNSYEGYQQPPQKPKKPFYKKWWFWLLIVLGIIIFLIVCLEVANSPSKGEQHHNKSVEYYAFPYYASTKPHIIISNKKDITNDYQQKRFYQLGYQVIQQKSKVKNLNSYSPKGIYVKKKKFKHTYLIVLILKKDQTEYETNMILDIQDSDMRNKFNYKVSYYVTDFDSSKRADNLLRKKSSEDNSSKSNDSAGEGDQSSNQKSSIPIEYSNALSDAENYSSTLHMSKQAIYDQLTSQDGNKFPAAAAQYAIDNLKADYNANALASAKDYQRYAKLSNEEVKEQLVSPDGGKFTPEQADYAMQHLND